MNVNESKCIERRLANMGRMDLLDSFTKALDIIENRKHEEPTCEYCDAILTEEEEEHLDGICMECNMKLTYDSDPREDEFYRQSLERRLCDDF